MLREHCITSPTKGSTFFHGRSQILYKHIGIPRSNQDWRLHAAVVHELPSVADPLVSRLKVRSTPTPDLSVPIKVAPESVLERGLVSWRGFLDCLLDAGMFCHNALYVARCDMHRPIVCFESSFHGVKSCLVSRAIVWGRR